MSSLGGDGVYLLHRFENSQEVPLTYVIQKTPDPSGIVKGSEQEIILKDPL